MVERRVLGLAVVSMILSSLIVASIAGEKATHPVEVLKNEYPKVSEPGGATFSFSVVFRENMEQAELRFYAIYPRTYAAEELVDPGRTYNESSSPEDMIRNVRSLRWFSEKAAALGLEPEDLEADIEIDGEPYELLLHDYWKVLDAVCGNETAANTPSVFGCVMNGSGYGYYLAGGPGFFSQANATMLSMTIATKSWQRRYIPDDRVKEGSGDLPLSRAPRGVLTLNGVRKDDVATVVFSLRGNTLPRPTEMPISMIQIIKIYGDAKLMGEPIINAISSGGMRA